MLELASVGPQECPYATKVKDMVLRDQPVAPYRSLPSTLMSGYHRNAGLETPRQKRPNALLVGRGFEKESVGSPGITRKEGDVDLRDGESRLPNFRGFTINILSLLAKKI